MEDPKADGVDEGAEADVTGNAVWLDVELDDVPGRNNTGSKRRDGYRRAAFVIGI